MTELSIVLDLKPPSVNHYWEGQGKFTRVSPEGRAFKDAIAILLRGDSLCQDKSAAELRKLKYCVEVWVFLGAGQKGDGDNMWKGILDGLVAAGAIHSDTGTAVQDQYMHVREQRDCSHCTTYISVRLIPENWLVTSSPVTAMPVIKDGKLVSI
jgi:Holliday junction resolvase RusA-like endonuclease